MEVNKFFDVELRGTVTIMRLISEDSIDHLLINELQRAIIMFVEQERPIKLLVDFSKVRRFSSETINALIRARRRLLEYHAKMCLCSMRPEIHEVFRLMRLDGTVFEIVETEEQGIASLNAN